MDTFAQDVRFALRNLRQNLSVTLAAVLCLALGIGASTTVYSTAQAFLLRPLVTLDDPDRVVALTEVQPDHARFHDDVAAGNYAEWRRAKSFSSIAAHQGWVANIAGHETAERVEGSRVTSDHFRVLGVRPAAGRLFAPDEDRPGHEHVVVLSHTLWARRFASDRGVIGQTVQLNGGAYTVIGVAPEHFAYPRNAELYVPLVLTDSSLSEHVDRELRVIARLKPGSSMSDAQVELEGIATQIRRQFPQGNEGWGVRVWPIERFESQGAAPFILVLIAAVALLLAIACVNVANLLLAKATGRQREIALRTALGAGRGRIVRQLLTESACLALLGGACGLLAAQWGLQLMRAAIPAAVVKYIPGWTLLTINWQALGYTAIVSLTTGLLFGLAPALQLTRGDVGTALREGGTRGGSSGGAGGRLRKGLVVAEMALAVMLLVGATLVSRSFINMLRMDPGFRMDHALTLELGLPATPYATNDDLRSLYTRFADRLRGLPGVTGVALTNRMPLSGDDWSENLTIVGRPPTRPGEVLSAEYRTVTSDYLKTMEMRLQRGRFFTDQDGPHAPPVAAITEQMARTFWPGSDPIGQRIRIGGDSAREIVGVLRNVVHEQPPYPTEPEMYVPFAQAPGRNMHVVMRTSGDPDALAPAVKRELVALDPNLAAADVQSVDAMVSNSLVGPRLIAGMLVVFAGIALVLAVLGLYGVMTFTVVQRTRELGIRMTLGAQAADVVRMVLRQGLMLAAVGILLGWMGAWALGRAMTVLLWGISASDPVTFIAIPVLLGTAAAVANYLPARRATYVDPAIALRAE